LGTFVHVCVCVDVGLGNVCACLCMRGCRAWERLCMFVYA